VIPVEHPAADRASAYGMDQILVDGNDPDAVFRVARDAIEMARAGDGPSIIEAKTYRHLGHSRADPGTYRPPEEIEEWKKRDPIPMYRKRLLDYGVTEKTVSGIEDAVMKALDEATEEAKASPVPALELGHTEVWADGGSAWRN